jgi:hypothetical protein
MHTIAFNYDETVFLFRSFWGNNMSTEYNPKTARPRLKTSARKSGYSNPGLETSAYGSKTLGPRSSALWVELNERGKTTFGLRDVEEITGLRGSSARTLIHKAERRGLVTQLRSGLYTLVPFELGRATEYIGDPYVIAREMCEGHPYFLSHASAMELHRMVTQPQFTIYVSSTMRTPPRSVHGHEYRFVTVKPADFFGLMQVWITKQQSVMVSDKERNPRCPAPASICRRHPGGGEGSLDESGRHQTPAAPRIRTAFFEWRSATATRVSARTLQDGIAGTARPAAHKADFDL